MKKLNNRRVTERYLQERADSLKKYNYPKPKWIYFCETMIKMGFTVTVYEARSTFSKYCTVSHDFLRDGAEYKVRFSDHMPNKMKETMRDCDFFVGKTHFGWTNTEKAIEECCKFFGNEVKSELKAINHNVITEFL